MYRKIGCNVICNLWSEVFSSLQLDKTKTTADHFGGDIKQTNSNEAIKLLGPEDPLLNI